MSPPSQVKASVKTSKFQNAKPPSSLKSFIAKAFERELFCLLFPPPPPPPPPPPTDDFFLLLPPPPSQEEIPEV
eukprot:CAMPEP_0184448530 /NCGR_PEP_ID=MMETSP0740-20130409/4465_1 /TAXON_ID=385413 /ORGANISM="Thalassiosira miniscula, Strain CCMP1093" /LENGTH=73 /DNA_ID=CAMNT_0026818451 /DNA_START=86 /DNA_END=307 /DNA_ORIENTATION=+